MMTRAHAALQLLRLGPLTLHEFVEITGWGDHRIATTTLRHLLRKELVCLVRERARMRFVAVDALKEER